MELIIYTVRDTKADACIAPFTMRTDFEAQRAFADSVNDDRKSTPLSQHPEDFVLLAVGKFDVASGEVKPYSVVKSLGLGIDFLVRKESNDAE